MSRQDQPLTGLSRLIRAGGHRRTRFHTERGDLLPLAAVPQLAANVATRLRRSRGSSGPWMVRSAVSELEARVGPSTRVLEVGAGYSTLWWARRVREVVTLEASADWAARLRDDLRSANLTNVTIEDVPMAEVLAALALPTRGSFDVAVVDCFEIPGVSRLDVLQAVAPLVGPGGVLVLDDSDRRQLWAADSHLTGWTPHRHIGVKPAPLMAVETTIFEKPPK
jgi:predicted O-methyltransferase YrrM